MEGHGSFFNDSKSVHEAHSICLSGDYDFHFHFDPDEMGSNLGLVQYYRDVRAGRRIYDPIEFTGLIFDEMRTPIEVYSTISSRRAMIDIGAFSSKTTRRGSLFSLSVPKGTTIGVPKFRKTWGTCSESNTTPYVTDKSYIKLKVYTEGFIYFPIPTPLLSCNSFTASPTYPSSGESVTLEWDTSSATVIAIDGVGANLAAVASTTVQAPPVVGEHTYTLRLGNNSSSASCTATIYVREGSRSPYVSCGNSCFNKNGCGLSYTNGRVRADGRCGNYPASSTLARPPVSTCFVSPGSVGNLALPTNTTCTVATGCLSRPGLAIHPQSITVGGQATLTYHLGSNKVSWCGLTGPGLSNYTLHASGSVILNVNSSGPRDYKLTCTDPSNSLLKGTITRTLQVNGGG